MKINYEMLPFIENCLLIQSIFLNFLWIFLFYGWVAARKNFSEHTLAAGRPGLFHWILAITVGLITFFVTLNEFPEEYWFLGLAIANGAFLSVLNPSFALCFTMSMLMMRPWEIMVNNELMLELPRFAMFFSLAWSVFYFVAVDRFNIKSVKPFLLLLVYALWVFLSTFVTPSPADSQLSFAETMMRAIVLFFLMYHLLRDLFSAWALKITLITIFTCVGLIAIVFYFEGYTDGGRIIAFGIFENTNDIAAVMSILLPLAATPFLKSSDKTTKILALFPILVALMVIGLAQSRGAIVAIGTCAAIYALAKIKRKMVAVVAILMILISAQLVTKIFKRDAGDLEGSASSRMSFIISGIRMAIYNPVFGVGYGQFPANFENYATEIVGEYGKRTAHSTWVLALAEGGWFALLLFGIFYLFYGLKSSFELWQYDPSWVYALAAYGTSISFLSHTYTLFPYLLVAAVTIFVRALANAKKSALLVRI